MVGLSAWIDVMAVLHGLQVSWMESLGAGVAERSLPGRMHPLPDDGAVRAKRGRCARGHAAPAQGTRAFRRAMKG